MNPQEAFIARLRRHRERNQISVEEIAAVTRMKGELLEAFERGDLSNWPRGLYARAWVRAYASVVGLDPLDTVDEFCRLFQHGDRRTGRTLEEMAGIVGHPSDYHDEFSHETDRRGTPHFNVLPAPAWHTALARSASSLWMRAMGRLTAASPRLKKAPRTSS